MRPTLLVCMLGTAAVTLALLSGCAFEPGAYTGGRGGGGAGDHGSGTDGLGPDSGVSPMPARACEFPDSTLRLCLDFEDGTFSPMVTDASASGLHGVADSIGAGTRGNSAIAATLAWGSKIDVAESPALDITGAMTIEMWVRPAYPQSANLLLNWSQYVLQFNGDERVGCSIGNASVWSDAESVEALTWTHVACVYDGSELALFVNGSQARNTTGAPPPTGGMGGTRIGGNFGGALDDIRVYARALTAAEACTHAGRTTCGER